MEALKYTCCLDKFGQVFLEEKNCESVWELSSLLIKINPFRALLLELFQWFVYRSFPWEASFEMIDDLIEMSEECFHFHLVE